MASAFGEIHDNEILYRSFVVVVVVLLNVFMALNTCLKEDSP